MHLKNFPVIRVFLPEDFSFTFTQCSSNSSSSSCSLHIRLPSFSILIKSLEILPLFVKKDLKVCQKFLLVIIPSFVASLKKSPFASLVKELHLFLVLLYEIKFFLDDQFIFAFSFGLSHYCFAKILSHERTMISLTCFSSGV